MWQSIDAQLFVLQDGVLGRLIKQYVGPYSILLTTTCPEVGIFVIAHRTRPDHLGKLQDGTTDLNRHLVLWIPVVSIADELIVFPVGLVSVDFGTVENIHDDTRIRKSARRMGKDVPVTVRE